MSEPVSAPIARGARLAGAIWGHLVGDAVGVPYEFLPASAIGEVTMRGGGRHAQPAGTWSDDGALMLALLDSLLHAGVDGGPGFDVRDQGRRALAWADAGAYTPDGDGRFDIGRTTRDAIDRIRAGVPAGSAGAMGERDLGNGSLMRVLPIALVERSWDDFELVVRAHAASSMTHGHLVAGTACSLYSLLARRLLDGATDRAAVLAEATAALRSAHAEQEPADWIMFDAALDRLVAWTARSGTGFVVDAFWSAWDAFAGAASYEDAVIRAVRHGNDTDTTAAIAGGLAGLYWGIDAIPAAWLGTMRGKPIVEPLVARLVTLA